MNSVLYPPLTLSRRTFILGAVALPLSAACTKYLATQSALSGIESATVGRIGVAAVNLANGRTLTHRGDERFAMCSTFKWLLAGHILHRVDHGLENLDRIVSYSVDDLVIYSPVTQPRAVAGSMTVRELCSASVSISDNTATNLLLATVGGPAGFTQWLRELGDTKTRLDRMEPLLNENAPGDPRDTTTPNAMLALMERVLFGQVLSDSSRQSLRDWMIATTTGLTRLRASFPQDWVAGDKTGTSENDANNDVAFAIPPPGLQPVQGPILVVSFTNAPDPFTRKTNAVHADIAREVFLALTG